MKKLLLLALPLLMVHAAFADDQIRNVQSQLKNQGFYYGEVDGQASNETTAAVRRYQIRNGLEVTGTLNPETLHALGLGPGAKSTARTAPTQPQPQPRKSTADDSDRNFLREEEQKSDRTSQAPPPPPQPSVEKPTPPPPPEPAPEEASPRDYAAFFARTPYFNAPREVQQETLRRAQAYMAGRGFYREPVTGVPGPATEEALLGLQRFARLQLTGRLDMDTLNYLRLLPGRGNYDSDRAERPVLQPFYPNNAVRVYPPDYPPRRVYRGIQVD